MTKANECLVFGDQLPDQEAESLLLELIGSLKAFNKELIFEDPDYWREERDRLRQQVLRIQCSKHFFNCSFHDQAEKLSLYLDELDLALKEQNQLVQKEGITSKISQGAGIFSHAVLQFFSHR